jgi:hypothetical protein
MQKKMKRCWRSEPSVKHGGGNGMVWDGGKVGDLYRVKGILKKEGIIPFCNAMPYPVDGT